MYKVADIINQFFSVSYTERKSWVEIDRLISSLFSNYYLYENTPLKMSTRGESLKKHIESIGKSEKLEKFVAFASKILTKIAKPYLEKKEKYGEISTSRIKESTKTIFSDSEQIIKVDEKGYLSYPQLADTNHSEEKLDCYNLVILICDYINLQLKEWYAQGYCFPKPIEKEVFPDNNDFIVK